MHTAIDYVDRHDLTSLTMRRLGKELGVEAMSLYRYVNGREDLLEGIVGHLTEQFEADSGGYHAAGWQAYLQSLAHAVRRVALAHPGLFPLVASRHPVAPWIRPPLRSLSTVEHFLGTLTGHGFAAEQAVEAYRAFTSFLVGYLLLEVSTSGASMTPAREPLDEGDAEVHNTTAPPDLSGFPAIESMESLLREDHTLAEFEQGLEVLLDRLDLLVSQ